MRPPTAILLLALLVICHSVNAGEYWYFEQVTSHLVNVAVFTVNIAISPITKPSECDTGTWALT